MAMFRLLSGLRSLRARLTRRYRRSNRFRIQFTRDVEARAKLLWRDRNDPANRRLSAYIPEDIKYTQTIYGQGEGSALIDGHEWAFCWESARVMTIYAPAATEFNAERAIDLVRRVAKWTALPHEHIWIYHESDWWLTLIDRW